MDTWTSLTLVTKVLIYISTASVIGGLFCRWLLKAHAIDRLIQRYMLLSATLGLVATAASFAAHVGAAAGEGLAGVFDRNIAAILWETGAGDATRTRLIGFVLVLSTLVLPRFSGHHCCRMMAFAGAGLLLFGFTQSGHLHDQLVGRALLAAHLLGISLWLGSLYPLWAISDDHSPAQLQATMQRFGRTAVAFVAALVIGGVAMVLLLVQPLTGLLTSAYGRLILIKLALVALLLVIAAANKLYLVPRLTTPGYPRKLRFTISGEMVTGFGILAVTSYLTTVTGPV